MGTSETGTMQQEQPQEVIQTPTTTVHDNPRASETAVLSDCDITERVPSRPR